jgi:hypothetical protein
LNRRSGRLPFLLPYARIELLIRTMLTETWAPEAVASDKARVRKGDEASPPHCAGRLVELNPRRQLLRATLGFLAFDPARLGGAAAGSLVRGTEPMGGSAAQPVFGKATLGDQNRKEIPLRPLYALTSVEEPA